jgi:hypothetical protein
MPFLTKGEIMGTRADFYVGKGKNAEWIGSKAWDGYEWGERLENQDNDKITSAINEQEYREAVSLMLKESNDTTTADMGWPWPWDNSCTTDCAYCFIGGKLEAFSWGAPWGDEDDNSAIDWPDMSGKKASAPAGSSRSGIMVVGI